MPSGIYKRKKKTKKARRAPATKKAATKKKRGRPPGSKNKAQKAKATKPAAQKHVRKAAGRANSPKVFADFGAVLVSINELNRMIDARAMGIIEALHSFANATSSDIVAAQNTTLRHVPADQTSQETHAN